MKRSKNSMSLTKAFLIGLEVPTKGIAMVYNTKEKGLSLYVTATGHKSFFI
jgi:hypothetical protein